MRLDHLQYLIVLSQSPSINAASQKLFLTPSTLSTAMKNLEEELGITLLNRTHTGITLTPAGKRLVKTSQRFLLDLDGIIKEASPEAFSTVTGNLCFTASPGVLNTILPRIICLFYQSYPQISVSVSQAGIQDIFDLLHAQQQEFALLYLIAAQDTHGLNFHPLFHTQLLLHCSSDSPLARYKTLSLKTAYSQMLSVYAPDNISVSFFEKLFNTIGRPPKVIYEKNENLCREMISFGLAVGISIQTPMQNPPMPYDHNVYIPIKDIPSFEFGYLINFETTLSLPSRIFLNHLKSYLSEHIDPNYLSI